LPTDILRACAVDKNDVAVVGGGRQRGDDLEYPDRVGIASAVESEVAGNSQRGWRAGGPVNARREGGRQPAYIGGEDGTTRGGRGIVIGCRQVTLGGHGNGVTRMFGACECSRRKSHDRSRRPDSYVSGDIGGPGAGDGRSGPQNTETA